MGPSPTKCDVIQRILKYAEVQERILESQESRAVFNDLQIILSCKYTPEKPANMKKCNLISEGDIIRLRNLMNLAPRLTVNREWEGM